MLDTQDPIEVPSGGYALKNGLIIAAIAAIWTAISYFAGLFGEQWTGYISMLLVGILVFIFQKRFRDKMQGGFIRFGKAYGMGVIMYTVAGIIGAIIAYFIFSSDPTIIEGIMEKTEQDMLDQGVSTSQIDQAMSITESMMTPTMMTLMGVFGAVIGGLIVSLITSVIVKRNHPMDMA